MHAAVWEFVRFVYRWQARMVGSGQGVGRRVTINNCYYAVSCAALTPTQVAMPPWTMAVADVAAQTRPACATRLRLRPPAVHCVFSTSSHIHPCMAAYLPTAPLQALRT